MRNYKKLRLLILLILFVLFCSGAAFSAEKTVAAAYSIQVGAYKNQEYVDAELKKLTEHSIAGKSGLNKRNLKVVYFGEYADLRQAVTSALKLKAAGKIKNFTVISGNDLLPPVKAKEEIPLVSVTPAALTSPVAAVRTVDSALSVPLAVVPSKSETKTIASPYSNASLDSGSQTAGKIAGASSEPGSELCEKQPECCRGKDVPAYCQPKIVGRRVDDSSVYMEFMPPSSERSGEYDYGDTGSNVGFSGLKIVDQSQPVEAPPMPLKANVAPATAKLRPQMAVQPVVPEQLQAAQPKAAMLDKSVPRVSVRMGDTLSGSMFASGKDDLTPAAYKRLNQLLEKLQGKRNIRLEAVGHTDNVRVGLPETRRRFGTNQRLSEARANAVARYLQKRLQIEDKNVKVSGKGEKLPIDTNKTDAGRARNRRTEVNIWFDDTDSASSIPAAADLPSQKQSAVAVAPPLPLIPPAAAAKSPAADGKVGLSAAPATPQPFKPAKVAQQPTAGLCGLPGPADLNNLPFRITVDGQAVASDSLMPEADRQRCVDVALAKADIQLRYDPLQFKPALNTWSSPDHIRPGQPVEFGVYSNYNRWIKYAEIRVFSGNRAAGKPLAVVPVRWDAANIWTPPAGTPQEMSFLLRVYDPNGRFDETALKPLKVIGEFAKNSDIESAVREKLTGWGQDSRALSTIAVSGGTVTVNGTKLQPGQTVRSMGMNVPVDKDGKFAFRQILPAGPHTVVVEVIDKDGSKGTFTRNLTIADQDWFYVALADLTVGQNHTSGPAALVTADTKHYDAQTYIDGRGAFYLKGKIKGEYLLTASADTREQPVEDLFRNFSSKDPRYLLRRLDPDYYYPVYGDDSTFVEDAPTNGKFYVRLEKGDSSAMWGNFKTQWTGSELTQFTRSLYGGQLLLKSDSITSFGEKKANLNAFAAEPGTLQSREEFRGTGGSLYYLHHLDLINGSDRIWVEARDKDSGMVLERKQLVAAQDYDINYLQGRLYLRSPLPSVTGSTTLIQSGSVPGNPVYLVASYEYVPGLTATEGYTYGGNASYWINDFFKVGVTGYRQGDNIQAQRLYGVDATARYTAETYLKAEVARSEGVGAGQQNSVSGGFEFSSSGVVGERADARRVEAQVNLADVVKDGKGKASVYWQDRDKGFSGPGQLAPSEEIRQAGGRVTLPLAKTIDADIKVDDRVSPAQTARSADMAFNWQFAKEWQASLGARKDERWSAVANASPLLSENGERTDIQGRLHYKPLAVGPDKKEVPAGWDLFSFVQGTAEKTGNRQDNNRGGIGGGWQATERFRLTGSVSSGDGGTGGTVGGDYRVNDRSNVYLNYTMETDRPDSNYRGRYGTAVTGTKYRVDDQMSVYGETRATHGAGPESLVNAFGLDLSPNDRWTYGLKVEVGQISDPLAGDLTRQALGFSTAYKLDKTKYAGSVEYRHEDGTQGERHVWFLRNSLSHQVSKDWRWIGKFNMSFSENSRGTFYDGDFVEFVTGGAYRPVNNDRWNALFKYTYFQDMPSAGQVTADSQVADYSQRSHVLSVDAIYDLNKYVSVGGKVGYRYSMLKPNKTQGDWFDSHAVLGVVRVDLHLINKWDALLEGRTLAATEAKDQKSGFLLAVYYHMTKNIKAGVGYNFTDFSDNMTDLSYRSHGWFLNVIGSM